MPQRSRNGVVVVAENLVVVVCLCNPMSIAENQHYHRGVCACCGSDTAYTRGVVLRGRERIAKYLIKWTVGDPSHGMGWLVSLPQADSGREVSISLRYSFEHDSFMVRHLGDEPWTDDDLAGFGELLDRDHVIGTPLAERTFAVVDEIWLADPYVLQFVASAGPENS